MNGNYEKKFQDCTSVDKSDSSPKITIDLGADIPVYEITITGKCMENFDINVARSIDMSFTEVCKASVTLPGDIRTFPCDNVIEGRCVFVKQVSNFILLIGFALQGHLFKLLCISSKPISRFLVARPTQHPFAIDGNPSIK